MNTASCIRPPRRSAWPLVDALRILLPVLAFLALCGGRLSAQANYQGAVDAKQTEIKWKQADLQAAQRELAILNQFLGDYDTKAAQLTSARDQLLAADSRLSGIQQDNLVKLTIRMGIETYNTVSDTINVGKAATSALISSGITSAAGEVAFDKLTNGLTNEGRTALGMDAETLSSPRTVRIKAVSDAARAAYPELDRVQQMLAMSLEGIKAAAYHEDGTELGDTGAILRKNIMVRDEIAAAIAKLESVGTDAAEAKTDAESGLSAAQAEVTRLTAELEALRVELSTLQRDWADAEAAERLAANQAATIPPADLPPPTVDLEQGETETEWEYAARVAAAIAAAAQARWDSEAPPIMTEIAGIKEEIDQAQVAFDAAFATHMTGSGIEAFIWTYGGSDGVDAATTASYEGSIGSCAMLSESIDRVTAADAALPGIVSQAEALADLYTTLHNRQNELTALRDMLYESGVYAMPAGYYDSLGDPGRGQIAAETDAARIGQAIDMFPAALANAQAQMDTLGAAADAWGSGIASVAVDIDANLTAAQSALSDLIARGSAWNSLLAASDGLVVDAASAPSYEGRLGYFSGDNFVPVVSHMFSLGMYKTSLLAAISTPGDAGLAEGRTLKSRYDTVVAATPALKDAYDAAVQRYQAAYARLVEYTRIGGYSYAGFPVLADWDRAAAYSSETHPVGASGVSDQNARYRSFYNTNTYNHVSSVSGGDPVVGQPVIHWIGLPRMRQLPDPGLDDPTGYLPHRLLAVKAAILDDGPTWIPFAPETFNANYSAVMGELFDIQNEASQAYDETIEPVVMSLFYELGDLHDAYVAAHPIAVISKHPAGSSNSIPPGATFSTTLSVEATGDFLTYEWFATQWPEYEYTWTKVGEGSSSFTTPALTSTTYYRVQITNPGGTVVSDRAQVSVYVVYPPPEFISAASATAQVGVPFTWTFTTNPPGCWISMMQAMATLPPGLEFNMMTATLSGTPLDAGTYDCNVTAFNMGTPAFQTFRLTIAPGSLPPYESWVVGLTTPEQRTNSEYVRANGRPAGDGVDNLLKFAFNLVGTGPGQAPSLGTACNTQVTPTGTAGLPAVSADTSGRLVLHYVRRKASTNPGITYVVESTESLSYDSWIPLAGATETVTSIDDTWERVQVIDTAPPASGTRFVRVRVTK